ncbi:MAG TPA: HIT family protein [Gemmatimonadaceae bacterium]|nr:HIT family protein [Gemmatimonadaceae bacterium]
MDHDAHGAQAHCTFCDLIQGAAEVSICHEDADSIAFMDIQPVNNGHVLVVPRQHYESLTDVPQELGLHLFKVTMRIAAAVRKVSGCDDLNIVVNSGAEAGQDEPHYHVHIIPRRQGDGFDIPLPFDGSAMPERSVLDAYAARIVSALRHSHESDRDGRKRAADRPAVPDRGKDDESDAARADVAERAVTVPVFDESNSQRASDATSEGRAPRRAGRWRAREGAHGELLYEPVPDNGDQRA